MKFLLKFILSVSTTLCFAEKSDYDAVRETNESARKQVDEKSRAEHEKLLSVLHKKEIKDLRTRICALNEQLPEVKKKADKCKKKLSHANILGIAYTFGFAGWNGSECYKRFWKKIKWLPRIKSVALTYLGLTCVSSALLKLIYVRSDNLKKANSALENVKRRAVMDIDRLEKLKKQSSDQLEKQKAQNE
jgi:hypothetical protein